MNDDLNKAWAKINIIRDGATFNFIEVTHLGFIINQLPLTIEDRGLQLQILFDDGDARTIAIGDAERHLLMLASIKIAASQCYTQQDIIISVLDVLIYIVRVNILFPHSASNPLIYSHVLTRVCAELCEYFDLPFMVRAKFIKYGLAVDHTSDSKEPRSFIPSIPLAGLQAVSKLIAGRPIEEIVKFAHDVMICVAHDDILKTSVSNLANEFIKYIMEMSDIYPDAKSAAQLILIGIIEETVYTERTRIDLLDRLGIENRGFDFGAFLTEIGEFDDIPRLIEKYEANEHYEMSECLVRRFQINTNRCSILNIHRHMHLWRIGIQMGFA